MLFQPLVWKTVIWDAFFSRFNLAFLFFFFSPPLFFWGGDGVEEAACAQETLGCVRDVHLNCVEEKC